MYCRHCYYDLRGQVDSRCPECGARFDPQDASTYLLRVPTRIQAFFRVNVVKTIVKLIVIAVLYGLLIVLFLPGRGSSRCGPLTGRQLSRGMLNSIILAHVLNGDASAEDGTLTMEAIRPDLARWWYSRSLEPQYVRANRWSRRSLDILTWSVLAIGPALAMIALTRRWARAISIAMASICVLLVLFSLATAYIVGGFRRSLSYDFVDDYVLVSNVDWRQPLSGEWNGLIAFEKKPWPRSVRVIATSPGTIRIVKESDFQERLSLIPIAKRAWDDCIAMGECTTVAE